MPTWLIDCIVITHKNYVTNKIIIKYFNCYLKMPRQLHKYPCKKKMNC